MEITPDKRSLTSLVEQAHTGKLCLPNFQREFVWKRDEVADLLRSVLRGYFIGSLLLLRCDPKKPPFAPEFLRGANPIGREPNPELLILDGQQRLSSLLYALTAPDLALKDTSQRRWFFIDLKIALNDFESDELVFDRSPRDLGGLESQTEQFKQRILPCTALMSSQAFLAWRDGLDDYLREQEPEAHLQFRSQWRDKWTRAVNEFQQFTVPLVELPIVPEGDASSIGRVCAIFEKLNSTGVSLTVYDLLTARLYRHGVKLHDLWDESCRSNRLLNEWSRGKADTDKFGVLVLRTVALLRGLDAKPGTLIELSPVNFAEDWKRATSAMEKALSLVTHQGQDGFGVFDRKWMPLYGQLPVLAALRAEIEDRKLGDQARLDLRRWYWSNVFLERYSSAIESKSRKDYSEFTKYWLENGVEPSVFDEARKRIGSSRFSVADALSQANAIYCGIFCMLAIRGAKDWRRQEELPLQSLQDHHIFPRAYLKDHGITNKAKVNTILNRTLISDETNNRIKAKAPADYLLDRNVFTTDKPNTLLNPHFIGDDSLNSMRQAQASVEKSALTSVFQGFVAARERDIIAEVRKICGVEEYQEGGPESIVSDEGDETDDAVSQEGVQRQTDASLNLLATQNEVTELVNICRNVSPPLAERASRTYKGSFRYRLNGKVVLGINVSGGRRQPPKGKLDLWVPVATLSEETGVPLSQIEAILHSKFKGENAGVDCMLRLDSPTVCRDFVQQIVNWINGKVDATSAVTGA